MARVCVADDVKLGKQVAVKMLLPQLADHPKIVRRFLQEAKALSRVRHPNVVAVTDVGTTVDGHVYMVMDRLHGEDLGALLRREGPLPWSRLGPIVLQICSALTAVHAAGIVHRDIKPSNCFRVDDPDQPDHIKLLDFGVAKVAASEAGNTGPLSTTGTLLGTPEYMAPELANGIAADLRADIYALGVLMYKLLTGTAPFSHEMYMVVLAKHQYDPIEPPRVRAPERGIPEAVEAVVMRALAKQREDRFQSAAAFAEAVAATLVPRTDRSSLNATITRENEFAEVYEHESTTMPRTRAPKSLGEATTLTAEAAKVNVPPPEGPREVVAQVASRAREQSSPALSRGQVWLAISLAVGVVCVALGLWSARGPVPADESPPPVASEQPLVVVMPGGEGQGYSIAIAGMTDQQPVIRAFSQIYERLVECTRMSDPRTVTGEVGADGYLRRVHGERALSLHLRVCLEELLSSQSLGPANAGGRVLLRLPLAPRG